MVCPVTIIHWLWHIGIAVHTKHFFFDELLWAFPEAIWMCVYNKQITVNWERFTGLNFRGFRGFQEYRESFPINIHKLRIMVLFKCFKHKAPFIRWSLQKFSLVNLSPFTVNNFKALRCYIGWLCYSCASDQSLKQSKSEADLLKYCFADRNTAFQWRKMMLRFIQLFSVAPRAFSCIV